MNNIQTGKRGISLPWKIGSWSRKPTLNAGKMSRPVFYNEWSGGE